MSNRTSLIVFAALLLAASLCPAQTTVTLAPIPQFVSYLQNGQPNAFGCVYTYVSGTTTPLATYTDATGVTENADPVVLTAGGTANIWLLAGQSYTFRVTAYGSPNCSPPGTTQYTVNGLGGGASVLTTAVAWSATPLFVDQSQVQLFTITLTGNTTALPLVVSGVTPPGLITFQITQDATGGRTFSWPVNMVGGAAIGLAANQVTTQSFIWNGTTAIATGPAVIGSGPALSSGSQSVNGNVAASGSVTSSSQGTEISVQNSNPSTGIIPGSLTSGTFTIGETVTQSSSGVTATAQNSPTGSQPLDATAFSGTALTAPGLTWTGSLSGAIYTQSTGPTFPAGTTLNTLTTLIGTPQTAVIVPAATTSGVVGITVAGAGTSGSATIQQSGIVPCVFDGATTAGDLVLVSATTAGECHDSGAGGVSGTNVGTVLSTNAAAGTYPILLFAGSTGGGAASCADGTGTSVDASTTAQQIMKTCQIPAGVLNSIGKTLRYSLGAAVNASGSARGGLSLGFGPTAALGSYAELIGVTGGGAFEASILVTCVVTQAGNSGTLSCTQIPESINGVNTPTIANLPLSFSLSSVNLAGSLYLGTACAFNTATTSNSCEQGLQAFERLN